jgi:hypothetical protein
MHDMNEQTPNEFTNEQYATFDQYLEEQIKRLKVSIDREVPESGPFKDVFDLFTNPDEGSRDAVSSYGIRIYKMRDDIVADPAMRFMEAIVYFPGSYYKASVVVGSGTNQELRTLINEPAFIDTLNNAYAQLLEIAEENT